MEVQEWRPLTCYVVYDLLRETRLCLCFSNWTWEVTSRARWSSWCWWVQCLGVEKGSFTSSEDSLENSWQTFSQLSGSWIYCAFIVNQLLPCSLLVHLQAFIHERKTGEEMGCVVAPQVCVCWEPPHSFQFQGSIWRVACLEWMNGLLRRSRQHWEWSSLSSGVSTVCQFQSWETRIYFPCAGLRKPLLMPLSNLHQSRCSPPPPPHLTPSGNKSPFCYQGMFCLDPKPHLLPPQHYP